MVEIVFATASRIGAFDLRTQETRFFGPVNLTPGSTNFITDVAGTEGGTLFVSMPDRLLEFDIGGGFTTDLGDPGRGPLVALGRGDGGTLIAGFNSPQEYVSLDPLDPINDQTLLRTDGGLFAGDIISAGPDFALVTPFGFQNDAMLFADLDRSGPDAVPSVDEDVIVGLARIGFDNVIGVSGTAVYRFGETGGRQEFIGTLSGLNGEQVVGAAFLGSEESDRFTVFGSSNTFDGGLGDDILTGTEIGEVILGGEGFDRIEALGGGDRLEGGAGDDFLFGGAGADELNGGAGEDRIFGGAGADSGNGGGGRDEFSGGGGIDDFFGAGGGDALLGGGGGDRLGGGAGRDEIDGGGGNDDLVGGGGGDGLFGGGGKDALKGGGARDALGGGGGKDALSGGGGGDRLDGGKGRDVLKGGGGADEFVSAEGSGLDRILDFRDGVDLMSFELRGNARKQFKQLDIRQKGDDLLIRADGDGFRVEDYNAADFSADDLLVLR